MSVVCVGPLAKKGFYGQQFRVALQAPVVNILVGQGKAADGGSKGAGKEGPAGGPQKTPLHTTSRPQTWGDMISKGVLLFFERTYKEKDFGSTLMANTVNRVVEFPGAGLSRLRTINSELNGAIQTSEAATEAGRASVYFTT